MKHLLLIAAVVLCGSAVFAQHATETSIEWKKEKINGVSARYEFSKEYTQAALVQRLAKAGLKNYKKKNGFMAFTGVKWNDVAPTTLDVYVAVEGDKKSAAVNIILSKGYDNYVLSANDPMIIEKVRTFLNDFAGDVAGYKKEQDILAQQKKVDEARKKLKEANKSAEKQKQEKEKKLEELQEELEKIKNG